MIRGTLITSLLTLLFLGAAGPRLEASGLPDPVYLLPSLTDQHGNRLPPKELMPGLKVEKLEHTENSPHCPGNFLTFKVYYPQGLGNRTIDLEIEAVVKASLKKDIAMMKDDGFCDQDSCGALSCGAWEDTQTFSIYLPSAGYLSILFQEYSFTGGAHGNTNYSSLNLDIQSGRSLTLTDLFPDPARSVPLYWAYVYERWCQQSEYKYPLHYQDLQPCLKDDGPDNPNIFAGAETLEDLGRLILTPQGLSLVLEPYESGSYAAGTAVVDIPREELLKMGAFPVIWGKAPVSPAP